MIGSSPSAHDGAPQERRAHPRRRGVFGALIVHSSAQATVPCAIVDMSKTGARVRLPAVGAISAPAYLIDFSHGLAFRLHMVWRRDDRVGFTFTGYYDLTKVANDGPPILRRLWIERQGR